jgi:L-ascorbate metabolism protein UlaG (beta-lactamase superfamily)
MKITFIGLSSYLIEDNYGGRLLIDLFHDEPEHSFGLALPKNLKADVFLVSHADSDHSNLSGKFVEHERSSHEKHEGEIDIFPNLNLRGTLVKEWNGDLCIAYHFTVDGLRCLHLADNSYSLTDQQISEFGKIDILFLPMPKSKSYIIKTELDIITKLKPQIIIPSHVIPLPLKVVAKGHKTIYAKLAKIILPMIKNPQANANTVDVFSHMLLAVEKVTQKFATKEITDSSVVINNLPEAPTVYYFSKCLAKIN